MQQLLINNLRIGFKANLEIAKKLAAGVDAADMVAQPVAGVNHPAWILRHLSAYHPAVLDLLAGRTPEDPKIHRFGMASHPEADASVYGTWDAVVDDYLRGGAEVLAALEALGASDESLAVLMHKMPVPRWQEKFPMAGSILGYLLVYHEGFHLGQFSAWRRFRGQPGV